MNSPTASATTRRSSAARWLLAALVVALASTVTGPAYGHDVSLGDSYTLLIPEIAEQTIDLVYTCDVDDEGNPTDCTPDRATAPGTKAVSLRLVWWLTGQSDGAAITLDNPAPAACNGNKGVLFGVATSGGHGEIALQMFLDEKNSATGTTAEQKLVDVSQPIEGDPTAIRRVVCFP